MPSDGKGVDRDGERRQVTVLFADVAGFTAFSERAGEEAAYRLMQRVTKLLRESVEAERGTIGSFTGDGVMALFGVPQALEDAPLRACRAALAVQQQLAAQAMEIEKSHGVAAKLRIGINTGAAVVGRVEGGADARPTALGDTINLAARLQALAEPGAVVLSEAAHRLVEGMVESRSLGEREVKGKAGLQRLYRLDALRKGAVRFDAALRRGLTAYVGRDHELEALERWLDEARTALRVVDIVGEPGIGKSRLLHEFRQRIGKARGFILQGSCSPDGQQTPFLPFIEIVRGSFRVAAGEAEAAVARKLDDGLKVLGLASTEHLGLLLNLLGLKPPEGSLQGLDGTLIGLRTRDLLQELLQARCRLSPVLMLVEDLHWIDTASAEVLGKIIDAGERLPLMVLHTRRPEYRPHWAGQRKIASVALEPLSGGQIARIVQARLGASEIPEALARLVTQKAEGNPLFAEEVASFLLDRGLVRRSAGGLEFDTAAVATALPTSVESLLTARIDRLSDSDRTVLQAAAVIGRRFEADLLASVVGIGPHGALATATALDLVHPDRNSVDYEFRHALIRDALYETLLSAPRAEMHLKVAEEIERRSGNRLVEVAEVLAHHFAHSKRAEKAFQYLSMAGKKSLDVYSLEESEQFFRRALALLGSAPQCAVDALIADSVVALMQAQYLKLSFPEVERAADEYMPRLKALGDTPQRASALWFLAAVAGNQCEFRRAHALYGEVLEIGERLKEQLCYVGLPACLPEAPADDCRHCRARAPHRSGREEGSL
jgi:class 3 adenylate cyclase